MKQVARCSLLVGKTQSRDLARSASLVIDIDNSAADARLTR